MTKRQYFADAIDILMCMLPAWILIFIVRLGDEFHFLNLFLTTGLVFLLYGFLSTIIGDVRTIGQRLNNIKLVRTTTGVEGKSQFVARNVLIAGVFISISDYQVIYIILAIVLFLPIKFTLNNFAGVSLLNFITRSTFVDAVT